MGHMVYLIDDKYLFTGDTLWFGADGGYSFISSLAEDNKLAVQSLAELERKLRARAASVFHHRSHRLDGQFGICLCHIRTSSVRHSRKKSHDPSRPMMPMTNRTIPKKMQRAVF